MSSGRFIIYNISFWVITGFLLFVNGWSNAQDHLEVAIVRYTYFPLIGLLITFAIMNFYKGAFFHRQIHRFPFIILASVLSGILVGILLNPLTYLMAGYKIQTVPHEILSNETFYFSLIFLFWSMLYFQLTGRSFFRGPDQNFEKSGLVFKVEKNGENYLLQEQNIVCMKASDNYVEMITSGDSFLVNETLSDLEKKLNAELFMRIHRSYIVNQEKMASVVRKSGGIYEITLEGGRVIRSSRSYKAIVEGILPSA